MILLGTGTSQGIPVIGCTCPVCHSVDPRDRRLRTAAYLRCGETALAIDCGPDFRQQMLANGITELDGILVTHQHNDHIIGLDDVRPFNFLTWSDMPVYATEPVRAEFRKRFAYVFEENPYPGAPRVELLPLSKDQPLQIGALSIVPVEAMHGRMPVLGFRIGDFAYMTDVRTIAPEEMTKLEGLRCLVLSALHRKPHHSHLSLDEALDLIDRLNPGRTYLTHLSHRMGFHADVEAELPAGVHLGYDGLRIELD